LNILYINHYAGSMKHGMEFRPYYLSREWIKKGHKVRIVTADFSHLRFNNPDEKKDFEIEIIDGIEYQWIHTGKYESNGAKRAITMFQFCYKLYMNAKKIANDFKPDVVITSSTYPLDSFPGRKIANIVKAKYIHEAHDIWPLTLTELMGMSKFNPFVITMAIAEKYVYKKSDHVVSVLPNSWKHMLKKGLQSKEKFTHIPNGIVMDDWENPQPVPDEHQELFKSLKNQGKKIVCYLGTHGPTNALDTLIEVAQRSNDATIAYVLVGKGSQKDRLRKKAENDKNIYFLPPVSKLSVPTILSMADILYIGFLCGGTPKSSMIYKYGVSMNKLYDYMMSGKPIIHAVDASNSDVDDAKCGISIEPCNSSELERALKQLFSMTPEEAKIMGENGKKAVIEKYNYKALADRFLEILIR